MRFEPRFPDDTRDEPRPQRLYLHEPGWRIGLKVGSDREFCYVMAPGQDFYHRLFDGEIYVFRPEERICLACAFRRGLISYSPKGLREVLTPFAYDPTQPGAGLDLPLTDDADWSL
jgi:hypothetical protein